MNQNEDFKLLINEISCLMTYKQFKSVGMTTDLTEEQARILDKRINCYISKNGIDTKI